MRFSCQYAPGVVQVQDWGHVTVKDALVDSAKERLRHHRKHYDCDCAEVSLHTVELSALCLQTGDEMTHGVRTEQEVENFFHDSFFSSEE